ncbi:MAG: hypothetical protein MUF36_10775 [Bacteroidales bacterium]|nr:hypothetical protein [Bacteroidales bacterium]
MAQETIIGYKKLELKYKDADEEITALLEKAVIGTEGGLRYSTKDIGIRMKYYGNGLSFIALYKKNKLVGVIGLCRRKIVNGGTEYNSTFLRYLSFRNPFQTAGMSNKRRKKLAGASETFKQQIFSMFIDPMKLPGVNDSSEPHVVYACIEGENERSKNFVRQAGYEHLRSVRTIAFSRFNPSRNPDVTKLAPGDEPAMAQLLAEKYHEYCFYHDQFSFLNHRYYVMKKDNIIVAGVCAIPTTFSIIDFPGIQGWILLKILPYLPYFRRIFKPGEFRFLVLDSIYCSEGFEDLLPDLFESVCANEGHYSGITWLDENSGLFKQIKVNGRMGVLNRILVTSPGLIFASFPNIGAEEKKRFMESPVYISGLDLA